MKIHGVHHCSDIAFEAELDPGKVSICRCTECQNISATAFHTIADVAMLTLIWGEP